jgi:hypothetical protein
VFGVSANFDFLPPITEAGGWGVADNATFDCSNKPCGLQCTACPKGLQDCTGDGFCDGFDRCKVGAPANVCSETPPGWDDPPGSGQLFALDQISIPLESSISLSASGGCGDGSQGCPNELSQLGMSADDQFRQGVLGGEALNLIEIAGPLGSGDEVPVTIKFYAAKDWDDPFYPANNFMIPLGETTCCMFKILPESLDASGQALWRARGLFRQGELRAWTPSLRALTLGGLSESDFGLLVHVANSRLSATVGGSLSGVFVGAVPIADLARAYLPGIPPYAVLDNLIQAGIEPDTDLDGDGTLDTLSVGPPIGADGRMISGCVHAQEVVPAITSSAPWTCALQPAMADGFSVGFEFMGVPATLGP